MRAVVGEGMMVADRRMEAAGMSGRKIILSEPTSTTSHAYSGKNPAECARRNGRKPSN